MERFERTGNVLSLNKNAERAEFDGNDVSM
jgi:hypothetical protein